MPRRRRAWAPRWMTYELLNSDPVWHQTEKGLQPAGKEVQVWELLGYPGVERSKAISKAESPKKT